MRLPLLAGNWKMHKTIREAVDLVQGLESQLKNELNREVLVCPPFTALSEVHKALEGSRIKLGAQDLYWEEKGAFTGEISPLMLKDAGCQYVIIGHSERRHLFKETNRETNFKVKAALAYGLAPILCVGETLEEREAGRTREVVGLQLREGLKELTGSEITPLVIAYEPVWAIGTGKTDTPGEANLTCGYLRELLGELFGYDTAQKIRILYGGSVKPENIDGFMQETEIDGALVGGAGLNVESFTRIVKFEEKE